MPVIRLETLIAAPVELCFDLSRDIHAHVQSAAHTGERIVECPPSGLVQLGDEVEFEARHFGVRQRLRSKIVQYDRPRRFVDEMQRGAFKRLRHAHEFRTAGCASTSTNTSTSTNIGSAMVDVLEFESPFGVLGKLLDALVLRRYMETFLRRRNAELKRMAETKQS
jgi:ligand-binding SRPBCC domain-containing protein